LTKVIDIGLLVKVIFKHTLCHTAVPDPVGKVKDVGPVALIYEIRSSLPSEEVVDLKILKQRLPLERPLVVMPEIIKSLRVFRNTLPPPDPLEGDVLLISPVPE
jgi:hypothetical protein